LADQIRCRQAQEVGIGLIDEAVPMVGSDDCQADADLLGDGPQPGLCIAQTRRQSLEPGARCR
jgi:hypothetical protein